MNEPGRRTKALGNVFKGGGGLDPTLIDRLRDEAGPIDLKRVLLVRGHFPLGIRELLPKWIPKDRELRCFTFLREPVDRTVSHYFEVRPAREVKASSASHRFRRTPPSTTCSNVATSTTTCTPGCCRGWPSPSGR